MTANNFTGSVQNVNIYNRMGEVGPGTAGGESVQLPDRERVGNGKVKGKCLR
jgi:hypothetical protein